MKLTNKMNLPEPLVKAVAKVIQKPHNKPGQYSVTTLQNGLREIILMQRHFDDIEVDVADEIWALFGTAVHKILEREAESVDGVVSEIRLEHEVPGGGTITGTADLYTPAQDGEEAVIEDYKTVKVFSIIFPENAKKWREQLMCYCALLRQLGHNVRKARVIAFLKDWSPNEKLRRGQDYPDKPVYTFNWFYTDEELDECLATMINKVKKIRSLEDTPDDQLPLCSPEERWAKPDMYAVKKPGHTKASRLFETIEEAEDLIANNPKFKKGYIIEKRCGASTKCESYCKVAEFCDFYLNNIKAKDENESN